MYRLNCDYLEGAHPKILEKLNETNLIQTPGYGADEITEAAKKKILEECGCEDGEVFFLVGGTQTNQVVLDTLLTKYEGVISSEVGHINVHEAGAIEYSGHKVIALKATDGKLDIPETEKYLEEFYGDSTYKHMVRPGTVYISHPTEYGTLYTEAELKILREICDKYQMKLFLDGARLGYGLASPNTDVTLKTIAKYTDVFYIGGTKVGLLFGEAVVFPKKSGTDYMISIIKQHGALLAKGRLLGVQFGTLFTDGLYLEISKYAINLAIKIKKSLTSLGLEQYIDSYTNQQFFILDNELFKYLSTDFVLDVWPYPDKRKTLVRITTSWATDENQVDKLISMVKSGVNNDGKALL